MYIFGNGLFAVWFIFWHSLALSPHNHYIVKVVMAILCVYIVFAVISLTFPGLSKLSKFQTSGPKGSLAAILQSRGGGTPLFRLYGDVPLDRVWFFGLAVLNRVCNLTCLCPKQVRTCPKQGMVLLFFFLACHPGPERSWKSMRSSGRQATRFFSWFA